MSPIDHRLVWFFGWVSWHEVGLITCEGGGDVVSVVTPLVRGGAQALHGDQVVELIVLLEVQEREEKGDKEEVEVEREKRVKEGAP